MSRRLRQLRTQVLPLVLFLVLVVVITRLWREHVLPVGMVGEAIADRAEVVTPRTGQLVQMHVRPFATVRRGDPLAVVLTTDPLLLEARLAVILAEATLLQKSMDPLVGRRRADMDYERLRIDLMSRRASKATTGVRLLHAENRLHRARQLSADGLIPATELEHAEADHAATSAELEGHREIIASLEAELGRLELPDAGPPDETMLAAIRVQEERLRLVEAELSPVTLSSPMDGQVGMIARAAGEHVMAGDVLMEVMSDTCDRILAYLRQPIRIEPRVGQEVRITAPSRDRGAGIGRILEISPQLTLLPEVMLYPGRRPEKALPLLISLPPGIQVRPGERLELSLIP